MSVAVLSLTEIISAASVCRVTGDPCGQACSVPEGMRAAVERDDVAPAALAGLHLAVQLGEDEQLERRSDRQRPLRLERCEQAGAPSPSRATAIDVWPGRARISAMIAAMLSPRMSAPVMSRPEMRCGACGSITICMCNVARSSPTWIMPVCGEPGSIRSRPRTAPYWLQFAAG